MNKLICCEHPHLVIQGEGNLIGKKMLLVRVAGCSVKCKDCDTSYSWQEGSTVSFDYDSFVETIRLKKVESSFDYVMITGGAPSLYKDFLFHIINNNQDINFQVEDAGNDDWNAFRNFENVWFSFSPKIGALKGVSDITEWKAFEQTPKNWICKVVVSKDSWDEDLKSIKDFQTKYSIPDNKIYLMPKGIHREEIIEQSQFVVEQCWKYRFNFSTRLHILLYDNKRLV